MKYILVNPEELVSEIEQNSGLGKDEFMTRIKFGQTELEMDFAAKFIGAVRSKVEKKTEEVDLTSIFEYQDYGVTPKKAREQLKKLVDIERFDNNGDGEEIVYVRYMSSQKMREKKEEEREYSIGKWSELEEKIKQLAPKQYSSEEIFQIVRAVLNRYIQDLQQREDIIFENNRSDNGIMYIGRGKNYCPENKVYSVNGENIIVSASIKSSDEPVVAPEYRMTKIGFVQVYIGRKGQGGQYESFAKCIKNVSGNIDIVACYMGDLYYSVIRSTKPDKYNIYNNEKGENVSEEEFLEFSKYMVDPACIDKLYEVFLSKIRFQISDKLSKTKTPPVKYGCYEVGDWPEKRPTNLDFEAGMDIKKIATRMTEVDDKQLIDGTRHKDETPTI